MADFCLLCSNAKVVDTYMLYKVIRVIGSEDGHVWNVMVGYMPCQALQQKPVANYKMGLLEAKQVTVQCHMLIVTKEVQAEVDKKQPVMKVSSHHHLLHLSGEWGRCIRH